MNGYLANLVARTLGVGPSVEPRLRSTFEPAPLITTQREVSEEKSGRETQSKTNALPRTEAQTPRLHSVTLDAETSKLPATAAAAKLDLDSEPTLLPLPIKAPEQETPAPQNPSRRSAKRALTNTISPDSPEPARDIGADAYRGRNTNELQENEGVAMPSAPDLRQRGTRPRSIISAPIGHTNEVGNGNNHPARELPPVVKVTIGRVEVRANFSPPAAVPRQSAVPRTKLSLDDYLKSRNGGGR